MRQKTSVLSGRSAAWRGAIYLAGILILAVGITLNTRTGLGMSTITAIPYAVCAAAGVAFSTAVFWFYAALAAAQLLWKRRNAGWKDLMQLPFSVAFSFCLGRLGAVLSLPNEHLWQRMILLASAVVCTGCGMAMILSMRLVPCPPDGLVQTLAGALGKDEGLAKNLVDVFCVAGAVAVDLLCGGKIVSVGAGTVAAMLLTGRVVAAFNRLCREKLLTLAGFRTEKNLPLGKEENHR